MASHCAPTWAPAALATPSTQPRTRNSHHRDRASCLWPCPWAPCASSELPPSVLEEEAGRRDPSGPGAGTTAAAPWTPAHHQLASPFGHNDNDEDNINKNIIIKIIVLLINKIVSNNCVCCIKSKVTVEIQYHVQNIHSNDTTQ